FPIELDYQEMRPNPPKHYRFDHFMSSGDGQTVFEVPKPLANRPGKLVYLLLGSMGATTVHNMKRLPWEPEGKMSDPLWALMHKNLIDQTVKHKADERLVFVGDSITQEWVLLNLWDKYYGAGRHAYNYGIAGDTTSNVIFRIRNQEFDGLEAIVTVLMIGTNNIWHNNDTAVDITHGIVEIINELLIKMPTTKILLLGNLPAPWPDQCKQLNSLLAKLANNKNVFFLDMWSAFVDKTGKQKSELFASDGVHPNPSGFEVWYQTMDPFLRKLYPLSNRLIGKDLRPIIVIQSITKYINIMKTLITLTIVAIIGQTLAETVKPWEPEGKMSDQVWALMHNTLVDQTLKHKADERIVFVGDSITQGWGLFGKIVWELHYGAGRHTYNYGISGDTTSNVIFRIRDKEFDGLQANVTVLMIGTNNIWHNNDTAEDVKHGITEIMTELLTKMPATKILLLGNLPAPWPDQCKELNSLLAKLANNKNIFFLDMWSAFVDKTGKQIPDLFLPDGVHPNESGGHLI
ncbi:unnamed protein product, partial [Medioppia subpectinata]